MNTIFLRNLISIALGLKSGVELLLTEYLVYILWLKKISSSSFLKKQSYMFPNISILIKSVQARNSAIFTFATLRENCPNTELFLIRIFLYWGWIQENTD